MELLETRLTHPYWLFRGWREGVSRRTLAAENISTVSAVMLDIHMSGGERGTKLKGHQCHILLPIEQNIVRKSHLPS